MEYFMRRIIQLSVLGLAAGFVGACNPDQVITTENIPTAGIRFINAVPDSAGSFGLDFRFVDIVESNAQFRIAFRNNPVTSGGVTGSTGIEYKNTRAGERHFRIFLDDTLQAVASTVLKDSTITVEANHLYTVLLWGNSRSTGSDKMRLTVIDETVADPGANVALRVINATSAAIDVRQYVSGGTVPGTATWANVAPYTASAYATTAPAQIRYNVQPAGGGTTLFADQLALIGEAAKSSAGVGGKIDTEALPGTTVAGSAVTLIVFPRSTAGSKAPQTSAFLVPAGSTMWDRRPPRPPGV
jgi:Domain of unknown function (DUF4397)